MRTSNLDTEKMIKCYFKDKKTIELLQTRVDVLNGYLREVQNDIDNSNITLSASMPAIDYTRDKIQVSVSGSVQENEVERTFLRLERQKEKLETEILELKAEIRDLKKNTQYMESVIKMLTEEARNFIELRYRKKKTYYYIAIELNSSATSISRLNETVLKDVSNWMYTLS